MPTVGTIDDIRRQHSPNAEVEYKRYSCVDELKHRPLFDCNVTIEEFAAMSHEEKLDLIGKVRFGYQQSRVRVDLNNTFNEYMASQPPEEKTLWFLTHLIRASELMNPKEWPPGTADKMIAENKREMERVKEFRKAIETALAESGDKITGSASMVLGVVDRHFGIDDNSTLSRKRHPNDPQKDDAGVTDAQHERVSLLSEMHTSAKKKGELLAQQFYHSMTSARALRKEFVSNT